MRVETLTPKFRIYTYYTQVRARVEIIEFVFEQYTRASRLYSSYTF